NWFDGATGVRAGIDSQRFDQTNSTARAGTPVPPSINSLLDSQGAEQSLGRLRCKLTQPHIASANVSALAPVSRKFVLRSLRADARSQWLRHSHSAWHNQDPTH